MTFGLQDQRSATELQRLGVLAGENLPIVEKEDFTQYEVAWPSGLRRWFKAPVSSEAWVRIPPLPYFLKRTLKYPDIHFVLTCFDCKTQWYLNQIAKSSLGNDTFKSWSLSKFTSAKNEKSQGPLGFEPRTYRTAADCSTTELQTQINKSIVKLGNNKTCAQNIKKLCQKWDLNPHPHTRTRILQILPMKEVRLGLESGALDHSAILTLCFSVN